MSEYCKCRVSSPSIHHEGCINNSCGKPIKSIYIEYEELQAENKKLRDCVEFYADENGYERARHHGCYVTGSRARALLTELKDKQ